MVPKSNWKLRCLWSGASLPYMWPKSLGGCLDLVGLPYFSWTKRTWLTAPISRNMGVFDHHHEEDHIKIYTWSSQLGALATVWSYTKDPPWNFKNLNWHSGHQHTYNRLFIIFSYLIQILTSSYLILTHHFFHLKFEPCTLQQNTYWHSHVKKKKKWEKKQRKRFEGI